jgi:hypothetical protein
MLFRNHIEELDRTVATLRSGHPSDHDIEVVPTLRVGADVPSRGGAVIPAARGGGTV